MHDATAQRAAAAETAFFLRSSTTAATVKEQAICLHLGRRIKTLLSRLYRATNTGRPSFTASGPTP
jgi:hypothetical protein